MRVTLSAIKADIGAIGGHTRPSDELIDTVKNHVANKARNLLIDYYIGYSGDDIHIIMTHTHGIDNEKIHKLAWDAFKEGTRLQKNKGYMVLDRICLKMHFLVMLKEWGLVWLKLRWKKGQARCFVLAADKTEPGAFNLPLWRTFIDVAAIQVF